MKKLFAILLVSICFSSCRLAFAIAASRSERVVVKEYEIENYKLTLVRKLDWAGPWYYGHEVRKKVLGVYGPKRYYWCNRDSVKNCIVRFEGKRLILDKCNKIVMQK